jgi:ADP-heptose:LPS heptosyltransferase
MNEPIGVRRGHPDDPSRPGFLAIAERGIGDALTLLPSLRALRAARPNLRIELLTPALFPLAENLCDTAAILDPRPLEILGGERRLAWLQARNLEWVWNTEGIHGPWTQALQGSTHPTWVTAPPQRTWGGKHVLRVRFEELQALFPGIESPGEIGLSLTVPQQVDRQAFRAGVPGERLLVAIQPGAGDPRRVWPAEKFRALASALTEQAGVAVVVFLSDTDAIFRVPGYLPDRPNLRLVAEPLATVVPKLAACDLCIANDSGFYHLAFNLGLNVVGIYRSLRGAQRWAYRSPRSQAVLCWMPRQLHRDWERWVSVQRVLRAARKLAPGL